MKPQAFIFIGRSGCGNGTQVQLLMDVLKKNDPKRDILYIQTGQEFRNFVKGESFTQKKSREINDAGGLQPEFLAIKMWENPLVEGCTGDEHIILDPGIGFGKTLESPCNTAFAKMKNDDEKFGSLGAEK